ncbi:MAG: XRE family transcriptional regulator [Duncaniella sp.]|nr:XRE family transcriptional regulator [Duncaniella sp.]
MTPIGKLIREELQAQERSVSWFARKLHLDRSNVYRLFQRNSVDTALLSRISIILGKNFFEPLSEDIIERNRSTGRVTPRD